MGKRSGGPVDDVARMQRAPDSVLVHHEVVLVDELGATLVAGVGLDIRIVEVTTLLVVVAEHRLLAEHLGGLVLDVVEEGDHPFQVLLARHDRARRGEC